jgi:MFS family permease
MRVLLGVAEAGFVPGIVYYLSQWFPADQRAQAMARFLVAAPVAMALGSPLSGWLLGFNGWHGLAGWQWVFLLEGIPSVLIGVAVLVLLTDAPSKACWLSQSQRDWLEARLERDADQSTASHDMSALRALAHPVVWLLSILYFLVIMSNWSYVSWATTVIQDTLRTGNVMTGLVTGAIAAVTTVVMLIVSASSDRMGERFFHASASLVVVALGWASAALLTDPLARVACFALVQVGFQSFFGPFWCLPSNLLRGTAAAAGIALVNSFGNLAGIVAPWGVGVLKERTGSMTAGMLVLSVLAACAAAMCIGLRWHSAFATLRYGAS